MSVSNNAIIAARLAVMGAQIGAKPTLKPMLAHLFRQQHLFDLRCGFGDMAQTINFLNQDYGNFYLITGNTVFPLMRLIVYLAHLQGFGDQPKYLAYVILNSNIISNGVDQFSLASSQFVGPYEQTVEYILNQKITELIDRKDLPEISMLCDACRHAMAQVYLLEALQSLE